ncbi:hypothetical protein RHMOL_Rhmol10G0202100 [Rhododendron molle]|uniref:Uncharacterized protein n=1 Tax=Rhododendron molle TaxID=49168 RepID=A0ACC0M631_RHOML|nr:hypothetical protein RHMOL_Rhmol10G0202100 [Rhododendron molle]
MVIRGEEPRFVEIQCAGRGSRCDTHGVTFGDPDILYWWRRWYNVSDLLDEQGELYTLEAFGAEELARKEEEKEL